MKIVAKLLVVSAIALNLFEYSGAKADVVHFDNVAEGTIATNQFPGVIFTGASVLTVNSQLNPPFPPFTLPNVVYDYLDGTITAAFSVGGITSVGGYITGNTSITLSIFSGATFLGSTSTGDANYIGAGTGLLPNIFLNLAGADITLAIFSNNQGFGNTFTLDNLTVVGASVASPVPLPAALPLFATILAGGGLVAWRRKRKAAKLAA